MEEQGGNFPAFFCPGSALQELLLLVAVTLLLLLLLDVDDSGSAMTVDETKDVSMLVCCDCVGTGLDIIGDDTDDDVGINVTADVDDTDETAMLTSYLLFSLQLSLI